MSTTSGDDLVDREPPLLRAVLWEIADSARPAIETMKDSPVLAEILVGRGVISKPRKAGSGCVPPVRQLVLAVLSPLATLKQLR